MVYNIKPSDLGPTLSKILDAKSEELRDALRETALQAHGILVKRSQEVAFDTGHYASAWKVTPKPTGATVTNDAPYAGVIEYGRRPGTYPNIGAILRWLKHKAAPIVSQKVSFKGGSVVPGRRVKAKGGNKSWEEQVLIQMAFMIARAIKSRGIAPKHVVLGAMPEIRKLLRKNIKEAILRSLE